MYRCGRVLGPLKIYLNFFVSIHDPVSNFLTKEVLICLAYIT